MSSQPTDEDPRHSAPETNRYRQFKSVGAKVAKAPQGLYLSYVKPALWPTATPA